MTQTNQVKVPVTEIVDQKSILYVDPQTATAICTVDAKNNINKYRGRVKELMMRADPTRQHLATTVYVGLEKVLSSPPLGIKDEDIEKTLLALLRIVKAQPKLMHLTEDRQFNELVTSQFFQGIFGEKSEEQMKDLFERLVIPCLNLVRRIIDVDLRPDMENVRWAEIQFEAVLLQPPFLPILSVFLSAPDLDCISEVLGLSQI